MGRPKIVPTFATGALYSGGPEPTTPTRSQPSAGKVLEGFEPSERVPMQQLNFQLGTAGDWLAYMQDMKVTNWSQSAPRGTSAYAIRAIVYDPVHDSWVSVGDAGITARGRGAWGSLPAGSGWIVQTGALGGVDMRGITQLAGNVVAVGGTGTSYLSSDGGFGWTSHAIGGGVPGMFAVAADTVHTLFIAAGAALYTSPDGVTWTSRVAASGTLQFNGVCSNPAGVSVAVGVGTGFGTSAIYRSTDGVTWAAQVSGTTVTYKSVAWDSVSGIFVAVGASGCINTSPDGVTWTAHFGLGGITISSIAVDGGHWVVGLPETASGRGAIAFSHDQGATWGTFTFMGDGNAAPTYSQNTTAIAHGLHSFYAVTDGGVILRSMRIGVEVTAA